MNSMKRLGLAALLAVLGALFTASPALARKYKENPVYSLTLQLAPPVDAPEPDASGEWTHDYYAGGWEWRGQYVWPCECATVSCQRLTPREQYVVRVLVQWHYSDGYSGSSGSYFYERAVTADNKGRLNAEVWVSDGGGNLGDGDASYWWSREEHIVDVWIVKLNENGEVVVLETQR